ncbi:MAG: hypothetical protein FJY67_04215, partial [Calditrichaeota bacterium]|nr:hypothetical protein [Calditrichota bacterium]
MEGNRKVFNPVLCIVLMAMALFVPMMQATAAPSAGLPNPEDGNRWQSAIVPEGAPVISTPEAAAAYLNKMAQGPVSNEYQLPGRDRRGGPDQGGYSYRDIEEAGVRYAWIDITQGDMRGNQLGINGDDQNSGALQLGWQFPFYGQNYGSIYYCSNGWISVSDGGADYTPNAAFPNANDPTGIMAAFFTDLYPPAGNSQSWWYTNADNGIAIFSWINYPHIADNNRRYTFQAIIDRRGNILFQHQTNVAVANGYNLSVGIQNQARNIGLSGIFAQNVGVPANEYAMGFRQRWIEFEEGAGISLDPAEFHFGDVFLGRERTIDATLMNNGVEDLVITGWGNDNGAFILPEFQGEFAIGSGEEVEFSITFRPEEGGDYADEGWIECNAVNAEDGVFRAPLTGRCLAAPQISVDPQAIEDALNTGEIAEHVINIANDGGADLNFEISAEIIREPGRRRDAGGRELRNADGGPLRDNPGDLIAQFAGPNQVNQYWSPVGYDQENDLVFLASYTSSLIV